MQVPPQISFHGLDHSDYNENYIRERIERLEHMHDAIISCRVAVEMPHRTRNTGNAYRVRVEVTIPRKGELVATKEENMEPKMELRTIIAHAFDAIEKQLRSATSEHFTRQSPMAPEHEEHPHGMVVRLFEEDGYGFIKTLDGREFYVHRNSVLHDDFDSLRVGTEVRFAPELGEKGPQASTVQIVANPGARASGNPPDIASPPQGWESR
jgi:cold shock CspA family protein/ribosome-associated translation inhibitor RaiA